MLGDFPWDPRLVCGLLGKDTSVVLEETDERAFLLVREQCPNVNTLGCVSGIDQDILHVLDRLEGARAGLSTVRGALGNKFLELGQVSY